MNGLGSSFVPSSTNDDLLSSQISFLNQTNSGTSVPDNGPDSQSRRAITGAHNFNNPITVNRSQTSPQQQQQTTTAALFKQATSSFPNTTSNWPTATAGQTNAWSTNSQALLNQPAGQQTQPSLNSWFNNTLNSLSKQQQQQGQARLPTTNLSASSISPLKKANSQLTSGSTTAASQQTLLNAQQQLGQLSPLSPKFRQNRQPLMNVNTLTNAMLMMQVKCSFIFFFFVFAFYFTIKFFTCECASSLCVCQFKTRK